MIKIVFFVLFVSLDLFALSYTDRWQAEETWSSVYSRLRKRTFFSNQGFNARFGPLSQTYFGMSRTGSISKPDEDMPYYKYINLDSFSPVTDIYGGIYRIHTGYGESSHEVNEDSGFSVQHIEIPWLVREAQLATRFIRGETGISETPESLGQTGASWITEQGLLSNSVEYISEFDYRAFSENPDDPDFFVYRPIQSGDVISRFHLDDILSALNQTKVALYHRGDIAQGDGWGFSYKYNAPAFHTWKQELYVANKVVNHQIGVFTNTSKMTLSGTGFSVDGDYDYYDYEKLDGSAAIEQNFVYGILTDSELFDVAVDSNSTWSVDIPGVYTKADIAYEDINYNFDIDDVYVYFLTDDGLKIAIYSDHVEIKNGNNISIRVTKSTGGPVYLSEWWNWFPEGYLLASDPTSLSYIYPFVEENSYYLSDQSTNYWVLYNSETIDGVYEPYIEEDYYTNNATYNIIVEAFFHTNSTRSVYDGITYLPDPSYTGNTNAITVSSDGIAFLNIGYENVEPQGTFQEYLDFDGEWEYFYGTLYGNDDDGNKQIDYGDLQMIGNEFDSAMMNGSYVYITNSIVTKAYRDSYMGYTILNSFADANDNTLINSNVYYAVFTERLVIPGTLTIDGPYNSSSRVLPSGTAYVLHNTPDEAQTNQFFTTSRINEFLDQVEITNDYGNSTYSQIYADLVFPEFEYENGDDTITGEVYSVELFENIITYPLGQKYVPVDTNSTEEIIAPVYDFNY